MLSELERDLTKDMVKDLIDDGEGPTPPPPGDRLWINDQHTFMITSNGKNFVFNK